MTLKTILCQRFGESISNLILGIDREDLDESLLHMSTKMMVTHIDVLGPRGKLGKPCQFKGTRVVFKNLTIHIRLGAKSLEILLPYFLQQPHDRNDVPQSLWHCNVLNFGGGECNLELEFGGPRDRASCIEDDPTTLWLGGTRVHWCKCLVPQSWEVSITVAFKTFVGVRLEI